MKNREVYFQDLGLVSYKQAWDYQEELFAGIVQEKIKNRELPEEKQKPTPNYLLFCEHPHVYTLGKSGSLDHLLLTEEEMLQKEIEFFKINRGGDITYHGPGQLVGYPILDLDNFFTDIHLYMRSLEEVIILTLKEYGIEGGRMKDYTGVWLDWDNPAKARKICAMGVKCSRWVTMHGWAFNVNSDLSYFHNIVPCGIKDKDVASLHKELGREVSMSEISEIVKLKFSEVFECELKRKF